MSDIQPFNGGDIIDIIKGSNGLDDIKPFQKDIYLFSTHIAGTSHVDNILELEPTIIENGWYFVRSAQKTDMALSIESNFSFAKRIHYARKTKDNEKYLYLRQW